MLLICLLFTVITIAVVVAKDRVSVGMIILSILLWPAALILVLCTEDSFDNRKLTRQAIPDCPEATHDPTMQNKLENFRLK